MTFVEFLVRTIPVLIVALIVGIAVFYGILEGGFSGKRGDIALAVGSTLPPLAALIAFQMLWHSVGTTIGEFVFFIIGYLGGVILVFRGTFSARKKITPKVIVATRKKPAAQRR